MKKFLLLSFISFSIAFVSCRKTDMISTSGVNLRFSADTVFLDTVFNQVNSSTYTLKVYNPSEDKVVIDNIRLAKGNMSAYRLNVNGSSTRNINDVEILGRDSIYIFIEMTDRTSSGNDPLITDEILFSNKGREQMVRLVTSRRYVHFHKPTEFILAGSPPNQAFVPYSVLDCNENNWTNDKPHVIYGYLIIPKGCELTINPGTEVYFHQNSGIWVANGGKLKVAENASPGQSDSVLFAGDRLEPFYEDVPGQWGGVLGGIFIDDSAQAVINLSVIKNAVNAIRMDSAVYNDQLKLNNSYILNTSRTAIYGGFGSMDARNVVVANSGLYSLFAYGGNYEFRHCTFANYWDQSTRTTPSVVLTNYFDFRDNNNNNIRVVRELQKAYFGNCIIYGNNNQELVLEEEEGGVFNYTFNHVLLKLDSDVNDRGFNVNDPDFIDPLVNHDPGFKNPFINSYDLDSTSQAIDKGNNADATGLILNLDIRGRIRNWDPRPDLGAFERQN